MKRMEALPCHFVNFHTQLYTSITIPTIANLGTEILCHVASKYGPIRSVPAELPKLFLTAVLVPAAINS